MSRLRKEQGRPFSGAWSTDRQRESSNTPDPVSQAASADGLPQPRRSVAIGVVLAAMAMVVTDGGLSNIGLPTIAHALSIAPAQAILIVTAYQAALAMALLPCAALGERLGFRNVFAGGVFTFTVASLACALSPTLPLLLAARFVQGLGGGAILALGVALLRFSVSDQRFPAVVSWNALAVALSAAAAPAVGALMLSQLSWQWLYAVNVPLGVGVWLAVRALPPVPGHRGRLDPFAIGLNCAVFGLAVAGAEILPINAAAAALLFVGAALALLTLIRRERPKARPLIPLDLLDAPSFRNSIASSILCFAGQTAGLLALPFYLQQNLGLSAFLAGLYLTIWPLSVAATALLAGRVSRQVSTGLQCAMGAGMLSIGLAGMAIWPLAAGPLAIAPFSAVCGIGFGLFQVANNRNMFLSAPRARSGAAGAMQGAARLSGQTAGALLVALVFTLASSTDAHRAVIGVGAALALVAGLASALRADRP